MSQRTERGHALAVVLHVVLLLLVLGQVVYLASRYRLRVDMTTDQVATTTAATRRLIERIEGRLVVEAYFSPKEDLPLQWREMRDHADNFLDELVQIGAGKVVLRRFDPNADKDTADTAKRLGIEAQTLRQGSATSLTFDQHWQGVRLRLGGKQEVLSAFVPNSPAMAEAILTPKLKEVMTTSRARFGFMEWPEAAVGQQRPGGVGWQYVRTLDGVKKRYDFQNYKDADGALLPADVDTLFLFRPKDLTDRQKYVIDQFVVGGGTLVVFADAVEYALGPQRLLSNVPMALDASGSKQPFVRQLEHYGIDWRPKLVADLDPRAGQAAAPDAAPYEYFAVPQVTSTGVRKQFQIGYPYFLHACNADWASLAEQLAKDSDGKVDERLAQQYRDAFVPGMPADEFLFLAFKKIGRGPGFYWPTWVGLRHRAGGKPDLPPGIDGRVLLWSSPFALLEDPPQRLDPIGRDPAQYADELEKFNRRLAERGRAEQRQQAPLMVEVRGRFSSFFAGMERPLRPSEAAAANDKPGEDDQPEPGADVRPAVVTPSFAAEPEIVVQGERPGRIVVVGDATFLRDDVVRGDYLQLGGPVSGNIATTFFVNLLDWINGDQDLVELQKHAPTDRKLHLVDAGARAVDALDAEQQLRRKTNWLIAANVLVPCAVLLLAGLVVLLVRRQQKRAFLAAWSDR